MLSKQTALPESVPQASEAEKALLGALMLESGLWPQAQFLEVSDFFSPSHQRIFQAMGRMRQDGLAFNPVLLIDSLKASGDLENVGGVAGVTQLWDGVPIFSKSSDVSSYAYAIKEQSIRRQLIRVAEQCSGQITDGGTSAGEVITRLEGQLRELKSSHIARDLPRLGDGGEDYVQSLIDFKLTKSLVTFGAGCLDLRLNGPNPGNLIIIGARTSVGKSVLALQCAMQTSQSMHGDHDPVVAFFSLEMSADEVRDRALQMVCGFEVNKYVIKTYGKEKLAAINSAAKSLKGLQIFTDDTSRLTPDSILRQCQDIKKQTGHLDLVVIDYFQLLRASTKRSNEAAELGEISRDLKISAMELHCPFIVPAQLNRLSVKENRKPRLDDLRGSGTLEQDADVVIMLHRPEEEDQSFQHETRTVMIAKQRNGWVGEMAGRFDKRQLFIYTPEEINGY